MLYDLTLVFILTFLVRIYSFMAGGGFLILIPVLTLYFGLDPKIAMATMKFGGLSSALLLPEMHKKGMIIWALWRKLTPWAILGSIIGTILVIYLNPDLFKKLISASIALGIVLLLLVKDKKETNQLDKEVGWIVYMITLGSSMLGALFGNKGIIMKFLYVNLGLEFNDATATNKANGLLGNIASVIGFTIAGFINWPMALTMFVAGWLGSKVSLAIGRKIGGNRVKRVFAVIVIIGVIMMLVSE